MAERQKTRWHALWPVIATALGGVYAITGLFLYGRILPMNLIAAAALLTLAYFLHKRSARIDSRHDAAIERESTTSTLDEWLHERLTGPIAVIELSPSTPTAAQVYPAAHERGYDLVSESTQGAAVTATLRRREAQQ